MKISETPWPIETHGHPFGSRKKEKKEEKASGEEPEVLVESGEADPEAIAKKCFENPLKYRDMVLERVHVEPVERFEGGSVYYLWLNKACPVGCEFCFFRSPARAEKKEETEITDEGIEKLIKITEDAKIDKFVVSGGGEPMMSHKKVDRLAEGLNVGTLTVVTSAFWSRGEETTDRFLSELQDATHKNPHQPTTIVRLSLDEFHLGRLSRGQGFQYVHNLINWFSANAKDDPKFQFLIHTMEGDKTVDELLAELEVESVDSQEKYLNRKKHVTLSDKFAFNVEYSQIFDSNPSVDLHDQEKAEENQTTFREFIDHRRGGNMSLSFHGEGKPKGVYFLTLYDGTNIVWGSSAPDVETSIYKDDYQAMMDKTLGDIVTLASLEKGPLYLQGLVSEVNPQAVAKAIGIGLRDFYARLLTEEDSTRFYVSVRLMQEYMKEGRIDAEQASSWPKELQALVAMDKDKLKEICMKNAPTIVDQYLQDKEVSVRKLIALYELVRLGHYSVDQKTMVQQVADSTIDPAIKEAFLDSIPQHQDLVTI